jgi:hypothetical protein
MRQTKTWMATMNRTYAALGGGGSFGLIYNRDWVPEVAA